MYRTIIAALVTALFAAAPALSQDTTSQASTEATTSTSAVVQLPAVKVIVVLDGSDVRALASVAMDLYEFSNTAQGQALIEALHSGGDTNAIADRFMDAFDRYVSLRYPADPAPAGPAPIVSLPLSLELWYHGPTLEQVVKEVIDDIFVSRPWTRIGARFPRISQRIRERMVARCNSLYNRIVWRKLREAHPQYLALANAEINRFTARFNMNPGQVSVHAYSANQQGWAGLQLDGKTTFSRSSREIREAFRDVADHVEKVIADVQKARQPQS